MTSLHANFKWFVPSRTAYSYNPEAQLYGQSGGGTYFDSQAGGAHVTTVVSSASGGVPPHGMVGIAMDVGSSHIISSGSTYLIHGGSMEGSRNHISHSSRSSSAMVSNAHNNVSVVLLQQKGIKESAKQTNCNSEVYTHLRLMTELIHMGDVLSFLTCCSKL